MLGANSMAVTLIGGPSVLIEIDHIRLVTDPTFDPPGVASSGPVTFEKTEGPAFQPDEIGRVDAVLLSHDQHVDNFDVAGRRFAAAVPIVLTTQAAQGRIGGNSVGLKPWETVSVGAHGELTITATPARHGPPGAEHTLGDVIGFVVSISTNEDLVYVTGDTVFYEGVVEVARRFSPRVVMVFAGAARTRGPYNLTMGNNDVLEVAKAFPHARILAVHNRGWAHFTEGPASVSEAVRPFDLADRVSSLEPGRREVIA